MGINRHRVCEIAPGWLSVGIVGLGGAVRPGLNRCLRVLHREPEPVLLVQSLTILNWGCRVQLKPGTYWESTVSGIASPRGVIPVSHIVPLDQQGKPRLPRRESGLVLIVAGAVTKGDGLEGGGEVGVQVPAAIDAGGFDEAAEIDGETFEVDGDSGAGSRIRSSSS
jgi:hypothetical protein